MIFNNKLNKKKGLLSLLPQQVVYHGDGQGRDKYVMYEILKKR